MIGRLTIAMLGLAVLLAAGCASAASQNSPAEETDDRPTGQVSASPLPTVVTSEIRAPAASTAQPSPSPECVEYLRGQDEIDLIVFLNSDVTDQDLDRISEVILAWDAVASVSFTSKDAAFEEFLLLFEGTPQIEGVVVADMPPSLRLTAMPGQQAQLIGPAEDLRTDPAIRHIGLPTDTCEPPSCLPSAGTRWEGGIDLIIFLNPDVTNEDIERIADLVVAWEAVTSVSFTSKQAAFTEFLTMFEGSDEAEGVTVSDMPPSLRLTAKAGQEEQLVAPAEELKSDPVVFEVVAPVDICDT